MDKLLNNKELEEIDSKNRQEYYARLKEALIGNAPTIKKNSVIRSVAYKVLPIVRNYDFCMRGTENIPQDINCLFVINHSNSHDVPTAQEALHRLGINQCFLASSEGLNPVVSLLFRECGAVLFNRFDKRAASEAFITMTSNLVNGAYGVIFSESTWNLHPYKPMHLIKTGAVYSAAIADVPIVPVIFEYIETNGLCKKENELYTKCVVTFGKPMRITSQFGLIAQTDDLQISLEKMRRNVWKEFAIKKSEFNDEDILRYLNHTYLKKFGGLFSYDSVVENKVLLIKDQISSENDYHLDNNGLFVPGNLSKEEGEKYIS